MAIEVKEISIEAHNSVKKVERYHVLLHYIYKIISLELKGVNKELIL